MKVEQLMTNLSPPILFGEVLYDCFPEGESILGGAPFNVAWHCQAFGVKPLFISRVGDDLLGNHVIKSMQDWGMRTEGLQVDTEHATGKVNVSFHDNEPSYDIVEDSAWDFINAQNLPVLDNNSILYHGSLALRKSDSAKCLTTIKKSISPAIFIDINLRAPWWNISNLYDYIQGSNWLKINEDELNIIVPEHETIEEKAQHLKGRLNLEFIVVTQGGSGAFAMNLDDIFRVSPENSVTIIDTVGAGDAFTSVLLLGLYKSWGIEKTIIRAQQFASQVVGLRGATTQDIDFYQPFIKDWDL